MTAQKKGEQRLLEVPMPISVVNTDQLATQSQVLLREYANPIPGLSVTPGQANNTALSVRGVTTGGDGNPTVGVLLDDLLYEGSVGGTGAGQVPDIDPGDLARIEVLRGPQGTLYGANSMGGLIRYVSKDPSTEGYSGRVEAGYNSVQNGTIPGFNLRGAANVPLSDDFAVRISGFERLDPGYIDNPTYGKKGVNEAHADGGRILALWRPAEDLSIKLNAYYQSTRAASRSRTTSCSRMKRTITPLGRHWLAE